LSRKRLGFQLGAQERRGRGLLLFKESGQRSLVEQLSAVRAADRAQFEDPVGFGEEVEVVLDHDHGVALVDEGVEPEFIGIVNYSIMGLIQLKLNETDAIELPLAETETLYDSTVAEVKDLMLKKNHDYGEAWRNMRVSSFTDMILMRLMRIRQIEDHQGKTLVSEGIDANYMDMMNYAVFALIKLSDEQ
jgi:hypothetical protein